MASESPQITSTPSFIADTQVINRDYSIHRHRPWRRYVTDFDALRSHEWEGEGTEAQPFVVTWLAKDPENPQTWSSTYKWAVTMLVAISTFAVALASSTYSGAVPQLYKSFPGYSDITYIAGLSVFVFGFAMGPLLWAPLSEVFGRRKLFIFSYTLFTCFNAGMIGSQNIWTIILLRFFAGAFGSSPLTNAGGTISDIFNAKQRGVALAIFSSAPLTGPTLGPIISGFLGDAAGWRWVFGLVAILSGVLTALGIMFLPETYAPVLLRSRAHQLSLITGKVYRSAFEKDKQVDLGALFKTSLIRPWIFLFTEPIVVVFSLYISIIYGMRSFLPDNYIKYALFMCGRTFFSYAVLYMFFAAFPIVYNQARGWSTGVGGLAFVPVLIGFLAGSLYSIFIDNPRFVAVVNKHGGFAPPEARLPPAILGGCCLPVGLFWFAWTAAPSSIHWIVSMLACVPFGFGMVLVFLSVMNYLVDTYLIYAASVLAANSVLRSLFGAAFPLFTSDMYHNLGTNWASTLAAFLALACAPMPLLFYKFGERIRSRCKYAAEATAYAERANQQRQRELEKTQSSHA